MAVLTLVEERESLQIRTREDGASVSKTGSAGLKSKLYAPRGIH